MVNELGLGSIWQESGFPDGLRDSASVRAWPGVYLLDIPQHPGRLSFCVVDIFSPTFSFFWRCIPFLQLIERARQLIKNEWTTGTWEGAHNKNSRLRFFR